MKTIFFLINCLWIISLNNLKAQDIPQELSGTWYFHFEENSCSSPVEPTQMDIAVLTISPYAGSGNMDTVLICTETVLIL